MAQGTEVERLAAIIAQHGAPSPSFDTALAERLLSAGVTLPPAPEPEAIPQWVEEAARVARGQRNTHTRRLTCDT